MDPKDEEKKDAKKDDMKVEKKDERNLKDADERAARKQELKAEKKDDGKGGPPLPESAPAEKHVIRPIEDEMKRSYIDYAMSVIVGRALPDVRDGLKPVQRRILYAMKDMGIDSSKPTKKSARVVGEVLGKYHPHGELAVYDALVRMAQEFSLRYMLIDGQGNFGSVDGDNPAAMRYTECRLSKIADEMLEDLDKETVGFIDNFDGSLKEPDVLPSRFPNLLVNGSAGIAVGMATNIPPHNLSEVADGIIKLIDNPGIDVMGLMECVKGPDFPTGGLICGKNGIIEAYTLGRGKVTIRARTKVEETKERKRIIVTEIPYQVNKSMLIESIATLVKEKKIEGITDLRDESDRDGMRIVIDLRRDVLPDIVLNQLFAHTQMQETFGIINLALVKGEPKTLGLKDTLQSYIDFREEVVRKRLQFDLNKAQARAHIIEGLLIAIENLDEVIRMIRRSKEASDAINSLVAKFILSEEQAKAILDMKLQKLIATERDALREEHTQLQKLIGELKQILESREKVLGIIKSELTELKEKYGDERRTELVEMEEELEVEDLIPVEDNVISITYTGYIKRLPLDSYRSQRRGGMGLIGMETKEEDYLVDIFVSSTHDYILYFTSKGCVHWLKAYKIPLGTRHAKGKPIVNLLPRLEAGERIEATIPVKEFDDKHFLIFATKKGKIKKTSLKAYSRPMIRGIRAIKLQQGDELVDVKLSDGTKEVVLATKQGKAVRCSEKDVRPMGRIAAGVRGVKLRKDDAVVSMAIVDENSVLLSITENGFGKRTPVKDYRKTRRGSQGVITIKTVTRNGSVVAVKEVSEEDELIVTSLQGMVIRIPTKDISVHGRATMGVRIMKLHPQDRVMAVERMVKMNGSEKKA